MSRPPTSHTVILTFLCSTVSTLNPIVGIVVTTSPSFNLYKMLVFPAASSPTIKILTSCLRCKVVAKLFTPLVICCPIFEVPGHVTMLLLLLFATFQCSQRPGKNDK
eukprot:Lithocolla_globosa_v1_NODE_3071_length_1772_cov_4.612922.p2 type:complete len:107 gc:universal NODE_3071_length_1772_cov_4.612922:1433-1753(+)